MKNYIMINGEKIELSKDSVEKIKQSLTKEDKLGQKFNKNEKYFRCDLEFHNDLVEFHDYDDAEFDKYYNERGLIFKNKENAEKLYNIKSSKKSKIFAQIQNWVIRNDDGWKADWSNFNQDKYGVYYGVEEKRWELKVNKYYHDNRIYMSKKNAKKLIKILNSDDKYKI